MTQETRMYIEVALMAYVWLFGIVTYWLSVVKFNIYMNKNDLNETFNPSNHSHLIIDFEKGENKLNNK